MMEMIGPFVLTLMIIGGIFAYRSEKKSWNDGICALTGEKWIRFDTDSQGGRGYKSGNVYTWISWRRIDRGYIHE